MPLLHTPDLVLQKLRGGADLMTPGLARGPPFPPQATKGAIVAIASIEKPSVPMVVGICEIDVSSLQQVQGVKGHAVRGQHWDGDEIWAWSQVGKPGRLAPEMIDGWDPNDGDVTSEPGIEHLAIEDLEDEQDDGGVILENNGKESSKSKPHNENIDGENAPPYEKVGVEEKELSTKGTAPVLISLYNKLLNRTLKKSTKSSAMPSSTPFTTIGKLTEKDPTTVSTFRSLNPL